MKAEEDKVNPSPIAAREQPPTTATDNKPLSTEGQIVVEER